MIGTLNRFKKWLGVELIQVSWAERVVAAVGSAVAIASVFLITQQSLPQAAAAGVIASMGASAVLLYAVSHGPLSQPWPLLGGHTLSAIIGVTCAKYIADQTLATAVAVGLAIGVMYQLKCIHPPGGATAFTAVMGGPAVHELGYGFVLCPVLFNAIAMLALAVAINYPFRWRRYPAFLLRHKKVDRLAKSGESEELHQTILEAMGSLDAFVDVSKEDLVYLSEAITTHMNQAPDHSRIGGLRRNSTARWNQRDEDQRSIPKRRRSPKRGQDSITGDL
ncbi:HPP family protein [Roseiconus lacunae]|uniref:HPP family protein n=1 Tax=Roseiconus lacunae TaxID=2605694 RepID=UPI0011F37EA4|nr:HPP family protein [Roseiconus lacunae]